MRCYSLADLPDLMQQRSGDVVRVQLTGQYSIMIRLNYYDAQILYEVWHRKVYPMLSVPPHRNVVDIGGYIGDFTLYALAHGAWHVTMYEPVIENRHLARLNTYGYPVRVVPAGVGCDTLRVTVRDNEVHASGFRGDGPERAIKRVPMSEVLRDPVDMLKMDCEGAELAALHEAVHAGVLRNAHYIALELHPWAYPIEQVESLLLRHDYLVGRNEHRYLQALRLDTTA